MRASHVTLYEILVISDYKVADETPKCRRYSLLKRTSFPAVWGFLV